MVAMLNFVTLVVASLLAAATAVAFHWVLLRAAFRLMQPATVRRSSMQTELVRGTSELARAFASRL